MGAADIIAPGADLAGSLATSALSMHESSLNRDFQRNMANTAHQREVKDLQAAGLNPILSANSGAPSPSGSVAPISDLSHIGSSFNSARQTSNQNEVNKAIIENTNAKTATENMLRVHSASLLEAQAADKLNDVFKSDVDVTSKSLRARQQKNLADAELLKNEATNSALGLSKARAESKFHAGLGGKLAPWLGTVDRALKVLKP